MTSHAWDVEYRRGGIPSSHRDDPSGVLLWALANLPHIGRTLPPRTALDVGCGTGRNAMYLANHGSIVTAFDSSPAAIALARRRLSAARLTGLAFTVHDLTHGLPGTVREFDLIADIFVYKHQLSSETRRRYRRNLERVLADNGVVLVSLAGVDDGYYQACPEINAGPQPIGARAISDPEADGIGSILFTLEALETEFADTFRLLAALRKRKQGEMHGAVYARSTLATLWERNV